MYKVNFSNEFDLHKKYFTRTFSARKFTKRKGELWHFLNGDYNGKPYAGCSFGRLPQGLMVDYLIWFRLGTGRMSQMNY